MNRKGVWELAAARIALTRREEEREKAKNNTSKGERDTGERKDLLGTFPHVSCCAA